MMVEENLIVVDKLNKSFKVSQRKKGLLGRIANLFVPKYIIKHAVHDVSFKIKSGEAVGFIGPNGAGKSTTLKILTGILYPDNGVVLSNNYVPYKDRKKYVAQIGAVFGQKSQLNWDLPLQDSYDLLKAIYRIPDETYKKNLQQFIDLLDMKSFINQPVRQLSLGQKMRGEIAAALLHSPKIVFLDEPTIGLDVVAKEKIRSFLRYINKEYKVTLIFTTHDMKDIVETCDRLIIIDKGSKIYDGSVEGVKNSFTGERKLIIQLEDFEENDFVVPFNVKITECEGKKYEIVYDSLEINTKALISTIIEKYKVKDLSINEPDIEAVVRNIYLKGIGEK